MGKNDKWVRRWTVNGEAGTLREPAGPDAGKNREEVRRASRESASNPGESRTGGGHENDQA